MALGVAIALSGAFLSSALSGDEEVTSDTESRRACTLELERFAGHHLLQGTRAALENGELKFGLSAALIVLLVVFGALMAGLIPLLLAIVSIVVALGLLALVGHAFPLSVFATNMLTGMGLALGIDYSLFMLSRYREERLKGRPESEAITAVGASASWAVLFSAVAFTLAMIGLLLVPSTIMRSLAAGAIVVALVSVAAALTLLPALRSLLGDRVNAGRLPFFGRAAKRGESRFWSGAVRGVMAHHGSVSSWPR